MDNNEQFIANITEKPPQIFGLEYVNVCVSLYIYLSHITAQTLIKLNINITYFIKHFSHVV